MTSTKRFFYAEKYPNADVYQLETLELYHWFMEWLQGVDEVLVLTKTDWKKGVDCLPADSPFKLLVDLARDIWLKERHWDLSYNQMCLGCMLAMKESDKIKFLD